jgi:hypothetical protein
VGELRTFGRREAWRRWAAAIVFAASVAAIAATSAAYTQIDVPGSGGTLHLDQDHPVAMARVVVRMDAETLAGGPQRNISLGVDRLGPPEQPVATGVPGTSPTVVPLRTPEPTQGGSRVQLIARADVPAPDPSAAFVPGAPLPWQADVSSGTPVTLPIECSVGPCERAFWLIGQLPADAPATDVDWHVSGNISYPGDWPSGAGASITIEPEVRFEGPAPVLAVSTPTETVHLTGAKPAAARLVELTIGEGGIPEDGSPAAALTVDARPSTGQYQGYPQLLLLDGPAAANPGQTSGSRPPVFQSGGDPFVGCQPASPCTRHVMVSLGSNSADVDIPWSLTLARADVVDAWSSPAELSAVVTRSWDVDTSVRPSTVHFEGDVRITDPHQGQQVAVQLATGTTSRDPYAAFLPVPGSLTARATTNDVAPAPTGDWQGYLGVTTYVPSDITGGTGAQAQGQAGVQGGSAMVQMNPMLGQSASCLVGERCPLVVVAISSNNYPNPSAYLGTYHWTLDVQVYSYAEVPIQLSGTPADVPRP